MGAVLIRARAELRSRWRAWLGLAAIAGLIAGIALAAVAGARRTDSVHARFLDRARAADVLVDNYPDPGVTTVDPKAVERLPQVESTARAIYTFVGSEPNFSGALVPTDGRLGRDVNRLEVVEGRLPDQDRVREIAVGFARARQFGWEVGTTFPLVAPEHEAAAARLGIENVKFRVVGLVAAPWELPPLIRGGPSVYHTRAFHRAYRDTPLFETDGQAVLARLRNGQADVPAFRRAVQRLAGGEPVSVAVQADHAEDVERSLDPQVTALYLFAAVLGLAGAVVLAQALARQAFVESADHATLHALGISRRQLWVLGILRALAVGTVAALIAVALAALLSPLSPLGEVARIAEPDPGLAIDATAFAVGGLATVAITVMLAAGPAWIAASGARARRRAQPRRPALARIASRMGLGAPMATGVRMALERGHGSSAVPVRTAIAGVAVGVMAFAAALTFAASSSNLLDTPRLYGWNWDLLVTNDEGRPDLAGRGSAVLARDPAIEAASATGMGSLEIAGHRVDALGVEHVRGEVLPPVVEGRAPAARGEIALGGRTMRELGLGIGDSVAVGRGASSTRMEIVGQTVLPTIVGTAGRLGEGALLGFADVRRLDPQERAAGALLRLAPGADEATLLDRLGERLNVYAPPMERPVEIVDFGQVRELPFVLAGILGGLATATLAHVLTSAVRRRRRDLAVLKALGFSRAQVRTVVMVGALTHVVAALAIGLPLGLALGRLAWNLFAEWQGIVAEVVVPLPALALAVPAGLLLAVALALVPARRAARTSPAVALRAE